MLSEVRALRQGAFVSLALLVALLVAGGCGGGGGGGGGGGASSRLQTETNAPEPRAQASPYTVVIWSTALTPADGGDRGGGGSPSGYCQDGVCGSNTHRPQFGTLGDKQVNFDGTIYTIESIRYGVDRELKLGVSPMIPTHLRDDWALRIGAAEFPLQTTAQETRHGHDYLLWDTFDNPHLRLSRAPWTTGTPIEVQLTSIPLTEVSAADASAGEGPDAKLSFVVRLSRAANRRVNVDYATSDGTATAGQDYRADSGTLTFDVGETAKTVSVTVLEDSEDEDAETLTLTLSDPSPSNVRLVDATATGTITNTDAMPRAWLARFGRTVAEQVLEAAEGRLGRAARPISANLSGVP